jgi:hypothetical protein
MPECLCIKISPKATPKEPGQFATFLHIFDRFQQHLLQNSFKRSVWQNSLDVLGKAGSMYDRGEIQPETIKETIANIAAQRQYALIGPSIC